MAIPAGWVKQPNTNSYVNQSFVIDGIRYEVHVNSETGASDLYKIDFFGNQLISSTDEGNNWALTTDGTDRLLSTLPPGKTTKDKANDYFSQNFTLKLNQNRANLLNSVNTDNTKFTKTPGVNNIPMSGTGTNPVKQAPASSNLSLSNLIDIVKDPLKSANDISKTFTGNEDKLFATFKLIYPEDLPVASQDTLKISQYRYKAPQNEIFTSGSFDKIIKEGLSRGSDYIESPLGSVILPMPNSIKDSNQITWGGDNMSALNAAVASEVGGNLPQYLGGFLGGQAAGLIPGMPTGTGQKVVSSMILAKLLQNFTNQNIKTSAGAGLVSTIAGAAGYEVSAESILSRGFGIVPNSNLELLFSGPQLRQFGYAYRLSPRSAEEAKSIRNIIRFFKQGMAARKSNTGSNFFLGTPNVFKLKFLYNGRNEIKSVNKIKTCALTGFGVDYAPSGQWASFDEGQPVSMLISMSFAELEPIYNTDYSTDNGVQDDSVGF